MKDSQLETLEDSLDVGRMTRGKKKALRPGDEVLTTEAGCRKREAVTMRKTRTKTAGMMYLIRPCGVTLGHMEMITGGITTVDILPDLIVSIST